MFRVFFSISIHVCQPVILEISSQCQIINMLLRKTEVLTCSGLWFPNLEYLKTSFQKDRRVSKFQSIWTVKTELLAGPEEQFPSILSLAIFDNFHLTVNKIQFMKNDKAELFTG
jgi:hypothetical protein